LRLESQNIFIFGLAFLETLSIKQVLGESPQHKKKKYIQSYVKSDLRGGRFFLIFLKRSKREKETQKRV
jgi:hypothetical protein